MSTGRWAWRRQCSSAAPVSGGTWSRPDKNRPAQLLDNAGNDIALTPGQTWVELAPIGTPVTVN
jgi:hypothetical protein